MLLVGWYNNPMPRLTRWFIKSSLVYLILALIIGVLQTAGALSSLSGLSRLSPVYFHLFLVGWVTELIFGVVYWMFPRYSTEKPRGHERLGWAVFGLLNLGLLLRAVGEPLNAGQPGGLWGVLLAVSAVLQWLAGAGFVVNTWPRVRAQGSERRDA
jgi:heme/copper-type cytochrome/quinol oxidase subunit 1